MGSFLNSEPNLNLLWFTQPFVSINKQTVSMEIQKADENVWKQSKFTTQRYITVKFCWRH